MLEEKIIKLYNDGIPLIEICEYLGTNRPYIYKVLKRNGIEPNRKQIAKEKKDKIISMYNSGVPLTKMDEKLNGGKRYSESVVYRHTKSNRYTKLSEEEKDNIRKKFNEGGSLEELANEYKCCKTSIWIYIKQGE